MRGGAATLFLLSLVPALARGDSYSELGGLERTAVDRVLGERGLMIDQAPEGKTVGFVHVVTFDVFQPDDGRLLEWFNHFHRVTRDQVIRRESLLAPGMPYDRALVDETLRTLRSRQPYQATDPPWSSIVAMVPVQAATPGQVDLLIVTRDVWSLRFNSDWVLDLFGGHVPSFKASLSENNFLGWRKTPAVAFLMDEGKLQLGPTYFDPNVLGSHVRLTAAFYQIWARRIGELAAGPPEGASSWLRLELPVYALSRKWGAFVDGSYSTYVQRDIRGAGTGGELRLTRYLPAPDRSPNGACVRPSGAVGDPYADLAACEWRRRVGGISSGVTRSFPHPWVVQRITAGHELGLLRLGFRGDFPDDPAVRAAFAAQFFGPSERTSAIYLQYDAFTPRYRTYRNLDTFDLGEDERLGPWLTLKLGRAATWLGSEQDFSPVRVEARVNAALLGGFQSLGASWEGRLYDDGVADQLVKGQLFAASPIVARAFRLVASAKVGLLADNRHRGRVVVGWMEGLRGYPINTFNGYHYYLGHLELRSLPLSLWSLRVGGVLFADAGHAADTWAGLTLYTTAGAGLRVLIPQLNAEVLRCDLGVPLRDYWVNRRQIPVSDELAPVRLVRAGRPTLYCGFRQAF